MTRKLPIVDVTYASSSRVLAAAYQDHVPALQSLVVAVEEEARTLYGGPWLRPLASAADTLNRLLGSVYRADISALADLTGRSPGTVIVANVLYDLFAGACSTFVTRTPHGLLHARNLDWEFPQNLLRQHTMIVNVYGAPAGPYRIVTWPGLFGVLTAVAPQRFSVSINYVRHADYESVRSFVYRSFVGYMPVTWAVRQVCDEASSFAEAVRRLRDIPLLAPVLLVVAGTTSDEAVVIERTPDSAAVRRLADHSHLCVTNHYQQSRFADDNSYTAELAEDTHGRLAALQQRLSSRPTLDATAALHLLSSTDLLSEITQHQAVMVPSTGALTVQVPGAPAVQVS